MDIMALGLLVTLLVGFHLPVPFDALFSLISPFQFPFLVILVLACLLIKKAILIQRLLQGVVLACLLLNMHSKHFYKDDFIQGQNKEYLVQGEIINDQFPLTCNEQVFCQHTIIIKPFYVNEKSIERNVFSPILLLKADEQGLLLSKGDHIRVNAKLNRPLGYENKHGFNFAKWSFAHQIYAKGKVIGTINVIVRDTKLSQHFLNKLIVQLSKYDNSAYFYPLLLAESSLLSNEQKTQLQEYGLSHLFAISGLHIGILFVVLTGLIRVFLIAFNNAKKHLVINFIATLGVWAYVYLIDFPIPSTRAVILLTVWLWLTHFNWHAKKTWLFAVMTISTLIVQPTGVLDAGWWLSIIAVAGIFIFNHLLSKHNNSGEIWLWSNIKLAFIFQIYIGMWLLPLSLFWFSGVSIAGFWLNIILVPVFCFFVIPSLFLAAALMISPLSWLSAMLFSFVDQVLNWSLMVSEYFSRLVSWLSFPALTYAAITAVIITLLLVNILNMKTKVALALLSVGVMFPHFLTHKNGILKVIVFDVGQGSSVLIFRNGKGILYDLGPVYASGFSATKAVVAPNVRGLGIQQLDQLIISHQDSDHYGDISAIGSLMSNSSNTECPKHQLLWQNTKLVRLWPPLKSVQNQEFSDNDISCVLKVVDLETKGSLLLTGDISRGVELELVEKHRSGLIDLHADVLFSAHHGSRFSSSYPFLKAVNAKHVIHTAGVFNHFGFPTLQVQQRVEHVSAKQYSTSNLGQLEVTFSAKNAQIKVYPLLNWFSPYWKKQNPFSFQVEIR